MSLGEYLFVRLPLSGSELQLISFSRRAEALPQWRELPEERRELPLSDEWDFSLLPCLDNRFGDYSLPASDEMVGPQVRAMRWSHCFLLFPHYQERIADASLQAMISLYPRVVPFSEPHGDLIRKEALPVASGSLRHGSQISLPVGGLKGSVSDAFLVMGEKKETMTGTEYVREEDGAGYIFATAVRCGGDCEAHIL